MRRNLLKIALLHPLLAALAGVTVHAQSPKATHCGSESGAVIAGTVVDDSTGKPIAGSSVFLLMSNCNMKSDSAGRFRFEAVRPRPERIEANYRGYRRFSPVVAAVSAGDSLTVVLRLKPGGPIQDCMVQPACATLLQDPPASFSLEESFRLIAYGTTIAIGWQAAAASRWHACVEDRSDAVIAELSRRYQRVVAPGACEMRNSERASGRLHHKATGGYAFLIKIDRMEDLDDNHRRGSLSYVAGGLWGQWWHCDFERTSRGWKPTICVQYMES